MGEFSKVVKKTHTAAAAGTRVILWEANRIIMMAIRIGSAVFSSMCAWERAAEWLDTDLELTRGANPPKPSLKLGKESCEFLYCEKKGNAKILEERNIIRLLIRSFECGIHPPENSQPLGGKCVVERIVLVSVHPLSRGLDPQRSLTPSRRGRRIQRRCDHFRWRRAATWRQTRLGSRYSISRSPLVFGMNCWKSRSSLTQPSTSAFGGRFFLLDVARSLNLHKHASV